MTRKPANSSQVIVTEYRLPPLHRNFSLPESHLCNLETNSLFIVVYRTEFFVTKMVRGETQGLESHHVLYAKEVLTLFAEIKYRWKYLI